MNHYSKVHAKIAKLVYMKDIFEIMPEEPEESSQKQIQSFLNGNIDILKFQESRPDVLAYRQAEILKSMNRSSLEEASYREKANALKILHEIERLERGKSTANISWASLVSSAYQK